MTEAKKEYCHPCHLEDLTGLEKEGEDLRTCSKALYSTVIEYLLYTLGTILEVDLGLTSVVLIPS